VTIRPPHLRSYVASTGRHTAHAGAQPLGANVIRKGAVSDMSAGDHGAPLRYEIRVQGHLHARWAAWFDGLDLTEENDGVTVIHGPVADQAALHGLLHKLRDVGLPLVSVTRVDRPAVPAVHVPPTALRKERP
jgi:hypothetical protein